VPVEPLQVVKEEESTPIVSCPPLDENLVQCTNENTAVCSEHFAEGSGDKNSNSYVSKQVAKASAFKCNTLNVERKTKTLVR
jgi:hypothetical protein